MLFVYLLNCILIAMQSNYSRAHEQLTTAEFENKQLQTELNNARKEKRRLEDVLLLAQSETDRLRQRIQQNGSYAIETGNLWHSLIFYRTLCKS